MSFEGEFSLAIGSSPIHRAVQSLGRVLYNMMHDVE
jgi:hypothetical protein